MNAKRPLHIALATTGFMLAHAAPAQCPRQQIASPSSFAEAFGRAVAMNDRHLLVGDVSEYSLCGDPFCSNGLAYAYERDTHGQWTLTQILEPSDLGWNHQFGLTIAIDGDRAMISSARLGLGSPALYVFEYDGEQWVETDIIEGATIIHALRGDTAISGLDEVLVLENDDEHWRVIERLTNPDVPVGRSDFGSAAAMSDEWIVVGAYAEALLAPNGGAAYAYRRLPDGQVEYAQKLIAPDVLEGPRLGESIAMQGEELFVGAPLSDRDFVKQGVVHVYQLRDGRWEHTQEITHDEADGNDSFGNTISVQGDRLVVGTTRDVSPAGGNGAGYVFERGPDDRWMQVASLFASQPTSQYARQVALWDDTVAIGAPDSRVTGEPTGVVDVFDLTCETCPADLDLDGQLTIFDFLTFLNLFDAGDTQADFDGDGELTIFDFLAFQTAFDAGCA